MEIIKHITHKSTKLKVYKNSKLTFGLSTTNLADFDFKIFYENGENEYLSSLDSPVFNVGTAGTVGIGTDLNDLVDASLTLQSATSTPNVLYYGLTKGGYISTADTDVQNYSQIIFLIVFTMVIIKYLMLQTKHLTSLQNYLNF